MTKENSQKIILIVDDDPKMSAFVARQLRAQDYQTELAMDGQEGLDKSAAILPDLILLDINMPEMDGFQVLEQLKTNRDTSSIPVVMISARSRPRDREDALFLGAVDYITKPWSEGELELRVSWALSQSKPGSGVTGQIDTEALSEAVA